MSRSAKQFAGKMAAGVVLVGSVTATLWAWQYVQDSIRERASARFEQAASNISRAVQARVEVYLTALLGAQGLFAASKSVERDEWAAYIHRVDLQKHYPGIVAMRFVRWVRAEEIPGFLDQVRGDVSIAPGGYPDFAVHPADPGDDEHYVVTYLEPMAGHEAMFGYDVRSEAVRRATFERARDTGMASVTPRVTLVTDQPGEPGFLMVLPVYRNGAPVSTVVERRAALVGFVDAAFRTRDLLSEVFQTVGMPPGLDLEVFDGELTGVDLDPESLLYGSAAERFDAVQINPDRLKTMIPLEVAGRTWTLVFTASCRFGIDGTQQRFPTVMLVMGSGLSVLLFAVAWFLATAQHRAMMMATAMTQALREGEQRLRAVVETARDAIISADAHGNVVAWNRGATQLFGCAPEEAIGQSLTRIIPERFRQAHLEGLARVTAGGEHRVIGKMVELVGLRRDGQEFPIELSLSTWTVGGQQFFTAMIRDLTERKRLQDQEQAQTAALAQQNQELERREQAMQNLLEDLQATKEELERQHATVQAANARLEQMAALKDEFVANVSHELRTPLTAIKEGVSLTLDEALGPVTADQREFLLTIDENIDRLAELINNMLDLSKIEAGRLRLVRRRLEITQFVDTAIKQYRVIAGSRTMRCQSANGAVPPVFADPNRLLQVIGNLLSNAIKFTPEAGTVTVRLEPQGSLLAISVADDGAGMAPEDLPKLFQKFSQVGRDEGKPRGTGLGLVVCKQLVELHQGTIEVTSAPGRGTTFTFTLPIYTPQYALESEFGQLAEQAQQGEEATVGLCVVDVRAWMSSEADRTAALDRTAELVRSHVYRGDVVLGLEPHWVAVLAVTDLGGLQAMSQRLAAVLRGQAPAGAAVPVGTGFYPLDAEDIHGVFAKATRMAESGGGVPRG